jgi:thiol-disulfide isomerase/thioredoxin
MVRRMKMRRIAITLGFLLGTLQLMYSQSWLIQGTIENCAEGTVKLASYYGEQFSVVDSLDTKSGFFYFVLSETAPPGIYRIIYAESRGEVMSRNRFVDFIFNRENVEMIISSSEQGPVPYFEGSIENMVYSRFMDFELEYESELMKVYGQLDPSRRGEAGYEAAVSSYNQLQKERTSFMDSVTRVHPGLYAVKMINAFRSPFIPGDMSHDDRIDTLKRSFFAQSAIDDPALLTAPVYTLKIIDYLSLYKVDTITREEQEEQYIEAADQIMANVSSDAELRSFVVEFMLKGFEMLDMEQVELYLADNYLDETCESDIVELILSRMEGYKKMAPGETAPDFVIRDMNGRNYRLSEMTSDYVLVVFWASSCDHCRQMMPELDGWYKNENDIGLEVIAISIDSSYADFKQYLDELNPGWITAHDPLGWYGKVPGDYCIYATPTLYLLDRHRKILARPTTFRQFLRSLKRVVPG